MSRCAIIVAVLLLTNACREKVPEPEPSRKDRVADNEVAPSESDEPPAASSGSEPENGKAGEVKELVKEDLVVGKGTAAKAGDTVKVHYTGTLLDGTKFDSSLDRGEPFSFKLGSGSVIKGWDEGVVGMKVGGKRKLTIPADKAYGKAGRPPTIPPNSPLVFEIQLLEIL